MKKSLAGAACGLLVAAHVAGAQRQGGGGPVGPPAHARPAASAPEAERERLRAQAGELGQAFVRGDFGKFTDMLYPGLVELAGGRERMIAFLEQDVRGMRARGFEVTSVAAGEPGQFVRGDGGRLFAVVPTRMRMRVPAGVLIGHSYFIGVSDGGGKWTFIDGKGDADKAKLRALLATDAVDKLELPEPRPPVLARP